MLGDVQLCDIGLDEADVAMVTIVLPVLLHKALHEVHGGHMGRLGQQVTGVAAVEAHRSFL